MIRSSDTLREGFRLTGSSAAPCLKAFLIHIRRGMMALPWWNRTGSPVLPLIYRFRRTCVNLPTSAPGTLPPSVWPNWRMSCAWSFPKNAAPFPSREPGKMSFQFFRENWIAKAVAVSLAIGFWYIFVPGSKTIQVSYQVPVSVVNVPADMKVEEIEPPKVNATFTGPRRAFYLLDSDKIKVSVDVALTQIGRRNFQITEQNIRYPKELTLQDIKPSTLRVSVKKATRPDEVNRG